MARQHWLCFGACVTWMWRVSLCPKICPKVLTSASPRRKSAAGKDFRPLALACTIRPQPLADILCLSIWLLLVGKQPHPTPNFTPPISQSSEAPCTSTEYQHDTNPILPNPPLSSLSLSLSSCCCCCCCCSMRRQPARRT